VTFAPVFQWRTDMACVMQTMKIHP